MKKIIYSSLFITATFMLSCKSETSSTKSIPAAESEVAAKKFQLKPFDPSQEYSDAQIAAMSYVDGKFNFDVQGSDYKLGQQTPDAAQKMCANSGKGQHIHLIVDNAPYAAKYTNEFDYEIPDGEHYLLAFLSRSYHESIKTDNAHIAKIINVKDNGITKAKPISEPMLFYSRPKGTYVGKAETDLVMLDFYPVNVNLGSTKKIIATINGEEHEITRWQPYYISGLPMGENTVQLSLQNMDGSLVDAPLNPVSRTFTLKADPAE